MGVWIWCWIARGGVRWLPALCAGLLATSCSVEGVTFSPLVEDCEAAGDEDGNGSSDCDDPACGGAAVCQLRCGDGVKEPTEVCDDGNDVDGDGCDTNCTPSACGNDVQSSTERCDDGNTVSGDGCDANCTLTACGNDIGTAGEICDDGNLVSGDGCDENCTLTGCGNNVRTQGEACDDGDLTSGDGCDANCTLTACGNSILTAGEACDDGDLVSGDGCDENCTLTECGNGVPTTGEVCDDGNATNGDGCDQNCTISACGNGVPAGMEACDDGDTENGDGCDNNCTVSACGNGIPAGAEICDDGNAQNGDGCDNDCTPSKSLYVKASNTGASDFFGWIVVLSADGSTLAVSARGEDSSTTGVNTTPNEGSGESGAVYVFVRDAGGAWSQQAYLKASNTGNSDFFGYTLAISADGSTLAVGAQLEDSVSTGINGDQGNGASSSGAVYVFARSGTTWSQQAYVKASNTGSNDQFGTAVALSGDGATLAVGAIGEDGVASDQTSNAATDSGAVYVFTRAGAIWSQQAYVKASNAANMDQFGGAVALSGDGATLAVAALGEDSSSVGVGGEETNNSATASGAVYVFARGGASWTQQAYVKASNTNANDVFGYSVSLSGNGSLLAVSALSEDSAFSGVNADQTNNSAADAGAVYVFARTGAVWAQEAYIKSSQTDAGDVFGVAVALSTDGTTLLVGANGEDSNATGTSGDPTNNSSAGSGAAYVLRRSGAQWSHSLYMKASNTGADDAFGRSVSLSANGASRVVSSYLEDSEATGISGTQANESASGAGAVYIFR